MSNLHGARILHRAVCELAAQLRDCESQRGRGASLAPQAADEAAQLQQLFTRADDS